MTNTSVMIQRQDPAIEAYRLGLLGDVQSFVRQRIEDGTMPPDYQVAQMSPGEQAAVRLAMEGIGAYRPFLEQGSQMIGQGAGLITGQGVSALQEALGVTRAAPEMLQQGLAGALSGTELAAARARASTAEAQRALMEAAGMSGATAEQGIAALAGTGAGFDPTQISPFMGQFEDAAVQQAMSDIARQGQLAQQGVRGQAVQAGAFGGSRQAVAEQELQRNVLEQQGRTAAQMRAAGFESAAGRAQQAFEQQQARQQQLASLTGQLGQAGAASALQAAGQAGQLGLSAEQLAQTGALQGGQLGVSAAGQQANIGQGIGSLAGQFGTFGTQLGGLGMQQAGIGELTSRLGTQDIQNLMATGGLERGVQQATLDAQRLTNLQRYSQPYQQFGFLSDIYAGVPTGQMTTTASSAPQVSPFQTALGLGIQGLSAAAGAQRAGLF
jgi:hypothetical protein